MKPLSNTASARWKRRNKAHVKRRLADWLARNKERRAAWVADYLARTKQCRKIRDAARNRLKRGDPVHQARRRAYMQDWVSKNREYVRMSDAKRRAAKRKNRVGDQNLIRAWAKSWKSTHWLRCYWCGEMTKKQDCNVDHIIPLAKGGSHSIDNLCVSCGPCNRRKHDRILRDWNRELVSPVLL